MKNSTESNTDLYERHKRQQAYALEAKLEGLPDDAPAPLTVREVRLLIFLAPVFHADAEEGRREMLAAAMASGLPVYPPVDEDHHD